MIPVATMWFETSHSLLDRLRSQDSTSDWEVFHSIYRPFIHRWLLKAGVNPTDVDDLCQEIMTRVYLALSTFRHNGRCGAFRCWLRKIVVQHLWRFQKRCQRQVPVVEINVANDELVWVDDQLQTEWEIEHEQHVLTKLLEMVQPEFTQSTWQAFVGMTLHGRSSIQVGEDLGMSPNAVLVAKSRVLARLRVLGRDLLDSI